MKRLSNHVSFLSVGGSDVMYKSNIKTFSAVELDSSISPSIFCVQDAIVSLDTTMNIKACRSNVRRVLDLLHMQN